MGNCSTCPSKDKCTSKTNGEPSCGKVTPNYGIIKNIIGVISGKGGVGKSTVTGILASTLRKKGYNVGVLDADITGPSMPRFFGINEKRAMMQPIGETGVKYFPVKTESGIEVMSVNLLIPNEDDPVIWRGPMATGVLSQLFTDTNWGELDYLLIDMPPGTSDITLTIMQSFPLTELIIVSTPQDMVSMIVKKGIVMANKMGVPVRGVIENMAYITCPGCDTKIKVFSKKSAEEHAEYLELPLLGELPINLDLTEALEQGKAEEYVRNNDLYSLIFEGLY
ncbi:Mrp/NBP35 family ATP-binding protein [Clostridium septicum]|uniref:Iron-sulfur cluster carrier protein n=1 Tax=Clostridium septicum TaxID=1504 RepID=A0A9N7JL29_CLOSE|nr:Mrp/NBP35 family ATP-binding protein [Clostridium septicum]AYE34433.1 sodium:proton antiporter [Clostridium septicum]MDU1312505.1 Mrp/NBP35 family ATP-binding protein [Clostridium septicum]QAS59836.1 sodium:proton antiporter [Clostridium septicum]UEC20925.1 Mrp/NBP35 family ATP-binding protein [Clostridium septicum]USS01026.1 Mrp/NBP35 family ATP-binding protein [Clostridium septicum]